MRPWAAIAVQDNIDPSLIDTDPTTMDHYDGLWILDAADRLPYKFDRVAGPFFGDEADDLSGDTIIINDVCDYDGHPLHNLAVGSQLVISSGDETSWRQLEVTNFTATADGSCGFSFCYYNPFTGIFYCPSPPTEYKYTIKVKSGPAMYVDRPQTATVCSKPFPVDVACTPGNFSGANDLVNFESTDPSIQLVELRHYYIDKTTLFQESIDSDGTKQIAGMSNNVHDFQVSLGYDTRTVVARDGVVYTTDNGFNDEWAFNCRSSIDCSIAGDFLGVDYGIANQYLYGAAYTDLRQAAIGLITGRPLAGSASGTGCGSSTTESLHIFNGGELLPTPADVLSVNVSKVFLRNINVLR